MRLNEFLTEQQLSDVHDALDVARLSLPYTYKMTQLKNNDFYPLYRFGVAIAAVRSEEGKDDVINGFRPNFEAESLWGENQIVTSFDPDIGTVIDKALGKINKKGKQLVSSKGSEEMKDTNKGSPLKPFKGYTR
jgi:hypothetical protein